MEIWKVTEVFNSMIATELNEPQKGDTQIVSVYPPSFSTITYDIPTVLIVYTEEDIGE